MLFAVLSVVSHSSWEQYFFRLAEDSNLSPVKASFPQQSLSSVPGGAWLGERRDAPRKLRGSPLWGWHGSGTGGALGFLGPAGETNCWVLCFHHVRLQAGASPCPESALVSHSWSSLGQALPELDIRPPPRLTRVVI